MQNKEEIYMVIKKQNDFVFKSLSFCNGCVCVICRPHSIIYSSSSVSIHFFFRITAAMSTEARLILFYVCDSIIYPLEAVGRPRGITGYLTL